MSVFTTVTMEQLSDWLCQYSIGMPIELRGIAAGIENTNYFVTTTQGRYVLTLFERLSSDELPFYLNLMSHLSRQGIPCPSPIANHHAKTLSTLNGKPATIVTRLPGSPVMQPLPHHCRAVGEMLARLHMAGRSYAGRLENPRGPDWWRSTAPKVMPFLDKAGTQLLESELAEQLSTRHTALPRGPIHADLFRDNVLWDGVAGMQTLGGVIDFYFAGMDTLLFDVAVTVNDWCVDASGDIDPPRCAALIDAYREARPFGQMEVAAWPLMLRAAALRFWLPRLFDFYLPRAGELTHAHDPEHFRRILERRRSVAGRLE